MLLFTEILKYDINPYVYLLHCLVL